MNSEVHFLGNHVFRLNKENCVMMVVQCINKYVDPLLAFVVACTKKGDSADVSIKDCATWLQHYKPVTDG